MNSYVRYALYGLNHCCDNGKGGQDWEVTLQDNHEYIYNDHEFLYSVFVDDHLLSITFKLRPGLGCEDYIDKIEFELKKCFFNIICHVPNLQISKPSYKLDDIVNEQGEHLDVSLYEYFGVCDEVFVIRPLPASMIYNAAVDGENAVEDRGAYYQKMLFILENPNRVIQFIGLYDIMEDIIYTSGKNANIRKKFQEMVCKFFCENQERYGDRVEIIPNSRPVSGQKGKKYEDSLTKIRNEIAHCVDRGIEEFIKVSRNISSSHIQTLLTVINDLLCGTVVP